MDKQTSERHRYYARQYITPMLQTIDEPFKRYLVSGYFSVSVTNRKEVLISAAGIGQLVAIAK